MRLTRFLLSFPLHRSTGSQWEWFVRLSAILSLAWGIVGMGMGGAQGTAEGPVYVAEIKGEIDLGLAPYLRRVLQEAQEQGAAAVVLDINTPGGRLDAALDMKNILLDSQVPTIAFVNREAFSAGALIAIATERIYMTSGAVLGAATPVTGTGEAADEKIVSAVRSAFRSVAEARGLDPRVAEAMVDPRVEVPDLVGSGQLLTLTTQDALKWDYAVAEVASLDALLVLEGHEGNSIVETSPGLSEALVRFITKPIVASLLIAIGFLGLLFELQSPGFGLGGAVGIIALSAFFGGHLIAGLAGWEGIALVLLGVSLLALEMFVIPGFGVAAILGIVAFLGGIYISLIGQLPTAADFQEALLVVVAALVLMLVGGYLSLRFLPKRSLGGIVLSARLASGSRPSPDTRPDLREVTLPDVQVARPRDSLEGARGKAVTDLHPAGTASIYGKRVDVVAEEGFVASGTPVEVILDEVYRRVVRAIPSEDQEDNRDKATRG